MAEVIVKLKVMPISPDADLKKLEEFCRIKFTENKAKFHSVSIEEVAFALSSTSAANKGIKVDSIIELDKNLAVKGDLFRLKQILYNLLSNAIKFTEKGEITISHTMNSNEVITEITDTGKGMSAETLEMLFRKYYKGEENVSRSGLGLGLYISKLCVEGSGGRIWAKSKEGRGSTFSFSLPIAK